MNAGSRRLIPLSLLFYQKGEIMTNKQIHAAISQMSMADLTAIKEMIREQEDALYDESWQTHDKHDEYIYIVHFTDGSYFYDYLGKRAYELYKTDKYATWIERKTKDLKPTYEFLERKEIA